MPARRAVHAVMAAALVSSGTACGLVAESDRTPLHALLEKSLELGLEARSGGQLQYLVTARR